MNKLLFFPMIIASILLAANVPPYSTTAVVTLVGAKIKSQQIAPSIVKYKRKDCPVCKGKGWYISGDGIAKINCGYCEPDNDTDAKHMHPRIIKK
jgi:hypothetical protein